MPAIHKDVGSMNGEAALPKNILTESNISSSHNPTEIGISGTKSSKTRRRSLRGKRRPRIQPVAAQSGLSANGEHDEDIDFGGIVTGGPAKKTSCWTVGVRTNLPENLALRAPTHSTKNILKVKSTSSVASNTDKRSLSPIQPLLAPEDQNKFLKSCHDLMVMPTIEKTQTISGDTKSTPDVFCGSLCAVPGVKPISDVLSMLTSTLDFGDNVPIGLVGGPSETAGDANELSETCSEKSMAHSSRLSSEVSTINEPSFIEESGVEVGLAAEHCSNFQSTPEHQCGDLVNRSGNLTVSKLKKSTAAVISQASGDMMAAKPTSLMLALKVHDKPAPARAVSTKATKRSKSIKIQPVSDTSDDEERDEDFDYGEILLPSFSCLW